jgi:hypothetical protein
MQLRDFQAKALVSHNVDPADTLPVQPSLAHALPANPRLSVVERPGVVGGAAAVATLRVRGSGELLVFSSQRPTCVLLDGESVPFAHEQGSAALCIEVDWVEGVTERVCTINF